MLNTEVYLQSHTLEDLKEEYGVSANHHPDGRRILNYSQIDSRHAKFSNIVRECRGLVLDGDNKLIAKSFDRFFNLGEREVEFDWTKATTLTKEDGSFVLVYWWDKQWRVNTKNSYGEGEINQWGVTWKEVFLSTVNLNNLDQDLCYTFELCSKFNQVVRQYENPASYLLTCTIAGQRDELTESAIDDAAINSNLIRPESFSFETYHNAVSYLEDIERNDPTFEGFVFRDKERIKIKNLSYLRLHRMFTGSKLQGENLVEIFLAAEIDEVLAYYPNLKPKFDRLEIEYKTMLEILNKKYNLYKDEEQKEFAIAIEQLLLRNYLFTARKLDISVEEAILSEKKSMIQYLERFLD